MRGRSNPRSRGTRRAHPAPVPDPGSLAAFVEPYLAALAMRAYSPVTVRDRRHHLEVFVAWCAERGITRPAELSRLALELYQRWLSQHAARDGAPLAPVTQRLRLTTVAGFCAYLAKQRLVLYNPASEIELPRAGIRLPHTVLSVEEVERVLAVPDVSRPLGLRDRAMLETLYSTGIRRAELIRLAVSDVDPRRGVLLIRAGKGNKDRVVPIGERALAWVGAYLERARPDLVAWPDPGTLFLTADGTPLGESYLGGLVHRIIATAGVGKQGSCHLFRHTAATLMLEGGADIRYIQQMLGHAKLDTTQIYTRVSIQALKAVHQATHPGARLERHREEPGESEGEPSSE